MPFRRLPIITPDLGTFYSVVDDEYQPHSVASAWLRHRFYAGGHSELTNAEYASSLALYLTWVGSTDLALAARRLHLFVAYLSAVPIESGRRKGHPRSAGRINRILVAVREFYRFAVAEGAIGAEVLRALYELDSGTERIHVRHRRREPRRHDQTPDQATAEEVVSLFESARTARDRFLIMLFALTGMRVGQALGLRRQDAHFVSDASALGLVDPGTGVLCRAPGEHLHVVRRRNPNRAWSKAQFDFAVPVHGVLLALYEHYLDERDACPGAAENDMIFVALRGTTVGEAISARNVNKIFERLAASAGLRHIHPHMLRHFTASEHLANGTTRDELQALLGWSQVASSDPYIHVSHERRRAAVDRLAAVFQGGSR